MNPIYSRSSRLVVNLDDFEDSLQPPYLMESALFRIYEHEKQMRAHDHLMMTKREREAIEKKKPVPKWKVQNNDFNAWKENKLDNGTIYNSKGETFASREELPPKSRPPSPSKQSNAPVKIEDVECKFEKQYVKKSTSGPKSAENSIASRFFAQTIKSYNRPKDMGDDVPYRSPRLVLKANENLLTLFKPREPQMESVTRVPSAVKSLPRKLINKQCVQRENGRFSDCFCDVLGPSTCKVCIEKGNRKIAGEMHGEAFPNIDCTVTALVAPRLAKFISKGEKILHKDQNKSSEKHKGRKASKTPTRVKMTIIAKDSSPKLIGKTRSNRPKSRKGILKLPAIKIQGDIDTACIDEVTNENTKHNSGLPLFGRAGVEKIWEQNAREYYANHE